MFKCGSGGYRADVLAALLDLGIATHAMAIVNGSRAAALIITVRTLMVILIVGGEHVIITRVEINVVISVPHMDQVCMPKMHVAIAAEGKKSRGGEVFAVVVRVEIVAIPIFF